MSDVNLVNGSTSAASQAGGLDSGITTMSPETLLAYCQIQLGDLDTQISSQMNTQTQAMRDREAIEGAQNVFQGFGTAGPQDATSMQSCVDAVDAAIAKIPAGDPVAGQLATFRDQMVATYHYQAGRELTDDEKNELAADQDPTAGGSAEAVGPSGSDTHVVSAQTTEEAQADINRLQAIQNGTFTKPGDNQWQGTTDALNNVLNDIKSNADIELLQLQDLVSQRQQAVQLVSGMMGKADQTLEDQAKAIGQ